MFKPGAPWQVFRWLLDRVQDDRGNASLYEYAAEDRVGVMTMAPWEQTRTEATAQRYLKRIRYGNRTAVPADDLVSDDQWMFEVVFDYGEHGSNGSPPTEKVTEGVQVPYSADRPWPVRSDPFSTYRPGFELRTYRRCRRVLMFHRFAQLGPEPLLVASTDLHYEATEVASLLVAVNHRRYQPQLDGMLRAEATPPVQMQYTTMQLQSASKLVDAESLRDVSGGLDGSSLRLIDLDAEGVPGLLVRRAGTWSYKRSHGGGRFAPAVHLPSLPTTVGSAAARLVDVDGSGLLSLATRGSVKSLAGLGGGDGAAL